jgi:filamentous hemagglutinin family protein
VLTIHQGSHHLITNWQSFSISSGGKVQFIQPSSSSVALNRVLGGSRSMINGALEANGQVILINPAGVTVGPGGSVNVNSFIASTLDVSDQEFISGGALNFVGSSLASVENHGVIHAAGGDAILIAREVINNGTINAPNGMVGLAAGSDVLVRPTGEERIYIRPGSAKGTVTQTSSGRIAAARAEVIAAGNPYAAAINLDGIIDIKGAGANAAGKVRVAATNKGNIAVAKGAHIKARQANGSGGEIALGATGGGNVEIAGVLDARGDSGLGGKIVVTGDSILLSADSQLLADGATVGGRLQVEAATQLQTNGLLSATGTSGSGGTINLLGDQIVVGGYSLVDTSSAAGAGGVIHVGGGFQGQDPTLKNALTTTIANGANLKADGPAQGGSVVVWSDYGTDFAGFISATGGNGGFVEVSGKQGLSFQGLVNTGGGTLLLDPTNVLISLSSLGGMWNTHFTPAYLNTSLASNNVIISADNDILVAAEVYSSNSLSWSSNHTLTLSANNTISIFGNIFASHNFGGASVDQIVITSDADNNGTGDLIIGGDTFDRTQIGAQQNERGIYISTNGLGGTAGNIRLSGNNIELRAGNVANAEVVVAAGQPSDTNGGNLFVTAKRDLLIFSGMENGVNPGQTTNASAQLESHSGKAVVTVGRNLILRQRAAEADTVPFAPPYSGVTLRGARASDNIALELTVGGNLYASGINTLSSGKNSVTIGVNDSNPLNVNSKYRITVVGDLAMKRTLITGYLGTYGDGIIQVGGDLISAGGLALAKNLKIWAGKNITFVQSDSNQSMPASATTYTFGSVEMQANGNISLGYGFTVDGGDLLIRADADVGSIAGSAFYAGGAIFNALGGAPAGGADGRGGFSIERDTYTLNISTGPGVTSRPANPNTAYTIFDFDDYNTATMQLMNPAPVTGGVQVIAIGSGNVTISTAPIFALQPNYNFSGNFRAETAANLIVGDYTTPGYRNC